MYHELAYKYEYENVGDFTFILIMYFLQIIVFFSSSFNVLIIYQIMLKNA